MAETPGFLSFTPARPIPSPCINVCRIDQATKRCEGCRRTLDEIARWTTMPAAVRDGIMAALAGR